MNVFKGSIAAGALSARFASDAGNVDSDLLVMSYAANGGGGAQVDQATAAPGGSAKTSVHGAKMGLLEVWVAIGAETDKGQLTVSSGGKVVDDEPIKGSVRWVYSVVPE